MIEGARYTEQLYNRNKDEVPQVKVGNFSDIQKPLPSPPTGFQWDQDRKTKEWSIVESRSPKKPLPANNNNNPGSNLLSKLNLLKINAKKKEKKEYMEHVVQPTDTFQGICLRYKVSATTLRQANQFSGTNLQLGPETLMIPFNERNRNLKQLPARKTDPKAIKLSEFRTKFPTLKLSEAKYYLELAHYDLKKAEKEAADDMNWEKDQQSVSANDDGLDDKFLSLTPLVSAKVP